MRDRTRASRNQTSLGCTGISHKIFASLYVPLSFYSTIATTNNNMRKPPGWPTRDYYDEERLKAIAEIRRALPEILEYGTEDDFVALIKKWRRDATPEELADWIRLFRASVREKRGLD